MAETLPYPVEIDTVVTPHDQEDLLHIENTCFASKKALRRLLRERDAMFLIARGIPPPSLPEIGPDDVWGSELLKPVNRIAREITYARGLLWCQLGTTGGNRTYCEVKDVVSHVDLPEDALLSQFLGKLKRLRSERDFAFLEANMYEGEPLTDAFEQEGFHSVHRNAELGFVKMVWPMRAWMNISDKKTD